MKKYTHPEMTAVTFDCKDIITTSGEYVQPGFSGWAPDSDDSEFG